LLACWLLLKVSKDLKEVGDVVMVMEKQGQIAESETKGPITSLICQNQCEASALWVRPE
jgi:hypothetical protein